MTNATTAIEWRFFDQPVGYEDAYREMEARVEQINKGEAPEAIWVMEHPATLTCGLSPETDNPALIAPLSPLLQRRSGGYRYYGAGIRMIYPMLRVTDHATDVACFVRGLEKWAIGTLDSFNLRAKFIEGRVGIFVAPTSDGKHANAAQIGAVLLKVRRGISLGGFSLNHEPDLAPLNRIRDLSGDGHPATSMLEQGYMITPQDLDVALMAAFGPAMESVNGSCTRF